ncbi:MAG TPA: response regulator, partial [Thermoleophilaceae bacterium]|nr:response regulator [Thermoleophilaceae bacterium]
MARNARVLVVEDDVEIAGALRRSLALEGYDVELAGDGVAALDRADVYEPDAVVLDLGLPKLDGVEVCRRLRERGDVPILVLTAREALDA